MRLKKIWKATLKFTNQEWQKVGDMWINHAGEFGDLISFWNAYDFINTDGRISDGRAERPICSLEAVA